MGPVCAYLLGGKRIKLKTFSDSQFSRTFSLVSILVAGNQQIFGEYHVSVRHWTSP